MDPVCLGFQAKIRLGLCCSLISLFSAGGPDHSRQWVDNALYQSTPTTPVQKIEEMSDIIFSEPSSLDKLKPKS